MTWYYELDEANNRIRLRFEDDSGTVHGPRDVSWPDVPELTIAPDEWPVEPNVKEEAGQANRDLYTNVAPEVGLQGLNDLAAGIVEEGVP